MTSLSVSLSLSLCLSLCLSQAMTPPEYGLDEFVDGVEALDMPDDVVHKVNHGTLDVYMSDLT